MLCRATRRRNAMPCGAATVELAFLLPFLMILALGVVDFCRLFYYSVTITDCAFNGALYLSNTAPTSQSPYTSVTAAALAEAGNLNPQPTVNSASINDSDGNPAVTCTVSYTFNSISPFPMIPNSVALSRTVQMRKN